MKNSSKRSIILSVLSGLAVAGAVFAQDTTTFTEVKPRLEIPIPGVSFTSALNDSGNLTLPWISQYINGIYTFLISIVGLVAAVMMIIGGFQYLTAGGDKGRVDAGKKRITNALIGMVLAFSSYAILYTINPALVQFEGLQLTAVQTELQPIEPDEHPEPTEENADVVDEPTPKKAPLPPGGIYKSTSISRKKDANCAITHDMTVATHVKAEVIAAATQLVAETKDMFGGPYKLRGGGFRVLGKRGDQGGTQVGKWEVNCGYGGKCGNVCNPFGSYTQWKAGAAPDATACPHTTGAALDVYCEPKTYKLKSGKMVTTGDKIFYVPCQLKFEKIMKGQGFCRLMHETWHYELPKFTGGCGNNWTGSWAKNIPKKKGGGKFSMTYRDCNGIFQYGDNGYSGKCLGEVDTTYIPTNPTKSGTPACR